MLSKRANYRSGRLSAQHATPPSVIPQAPGLHQLPVGRSRTNLLYVPAGYDSGRAATLAVMLHGAGGDAAHGMSLLQHHADAANMIIVAPASEDYSWDIIASESFGNDVFLIDQLLEHIFGNFLIDATRVVIGGFSDGASYALSLGLGNGDLFTHIVAFSPGFFFTPAHVGKPGVYISHGLHDRVLPIDPCSRRIVPKLKGKGYAVQYHEFDGEHIIPAEVATEALQWLNK